MTPDIDKIAELVADKLEARQIEKEASKIANLYRRNSIFQKVQKITQTRLFLKGSVFLCFRKEKQNDNAII